MSEVQKVQSWSPVGKAFSLLQGLYTLARDIYADMSIGMEFLPWLLDEKGGRPHLVERLKARGVQFDVCEITLRNRKLKKEQFIADATYVPSGVAEITRLQQREGYAYLRP